MCHEAVGPHSGPYGARAYRRVRCADRAPPAEVMIKAPGRYHNPDFDYDYDYDYDYDNDAMSIP